MTIRLFQIMYFLVALLHPSVSVGVAWPLAQAVHESAKFTSNLATTYNNLFGMMYPQIRKTCAIGKTDKGFAIYRSKLDSIRDYFMWLTQMDIKNDADLLVFIQTRYATDKNYYTKVSAQVAALQSQIISGGQVAVGAAVAGLAGLLVSKAVQS